MLFVTQRLTSYGAVLKQRLSGVNTYQIRNFMPPSKQHYQAKLTPVDPMTPYEFLYMREVVRGSVILPLRRFSKVTAVIQDFRVKQVILALASQIRGSRSRGSYRCSGSRPVGFGLLKRN